MTDEDELYNALANNAGLEKCAELLAEQLAEAQTELEVLRHVNRWQAAELASVLEKVDDLCERFELEGLHSHPTYKQFKRLFAELKAARCPVEPPTLSVNEWPKGASVVFSGSDRSVTLLQPGESVMLQPGDSLRSPKWLAEDLDQRIEDWHEGRAGHDQQLHEYLGLSWADYSAWVTHPADFPKEPTMYSPYRGPVHQGLLAHLDYLLQLLPLTTEDGLPQLLTACLAVPRCLQDLQQIDAIAASDLEDRIHAAFAACYPLAGEPQ